MKRVALIVLVILALLLFAVGARREEDPITLPPEPKVDETSAATVRFDDTSVVVEVADTSALRTQGLSGRASLASGTGMLFVFEREDTYGFWMKDMRFPIDIIWLRPVSGRVPEAAAGTNGIDAVPVEIVYVVHGATPESYPAIFEPLLPAQYVLEVPVGFVEGHRVKFGDRAEIHLPS
ncbi:DUF192 domain-containing protein [Candidatus Wolfebacteria bacterium]|nr:DUF192 domain-containing protein [Candidatus Wolfebacteria bacterium]